MEETPQRIEPAFLQERLPPELTDLALAVQAASLRLPGRLPAAAVRELAELVAITNSHYSNLIEGNNTRPADIEAALRNHSSEDRPLLMEATAHVHLQRRIDALAADRALPIPTETPFLKGLHREFYDKMPAEHRVSRLGDREVTIVPGAFRNRPEEDVAVGRHHPPTSSRVDDFMAAFSARYAQVKGQTGLILAIPAAHHRFNYIHPFVDGNGRVSRLMSHAMGHRAGIASGGLWSISRGLARGLNGPLDYKAMMNATDRARQGDLDGRGNLSEKALIEFSKWFLEVALDQIEFCANAFDLDSLGRRYRTHLRLRYADDRPGALVSKVLELGEVDRGLATTIAGGSERTGRNILLSCTRGGFLKSDTPKGKVRVAFPQSDLVWIFPNLFSEGPVSDRPPPMPPIKTEEPDGPEPPARSRKKKDGWEL